MKNILYLFALVVLITSCSEHQKAIKSEDIAVKFVTATKMYEAKKYSKAIRLFEQIAPAYKGKPQAEHMFFMYSQSLYKTNQFYLAGYQFESFIKAYPLSQKVDEAAYLGAYSYYKTSPVFSLDQKETLTAIDKLQEFINTYPNSEKMSDANDLVQELRIKLEYKAFEIAKQFNTIRTNSQIRQFCLDLF